jgi:raffinose/stachyose/melibiose transport system substrate-binding protein
MANALLSQADLSRSDFSYADLRGADLRGADLREARLNGADLSGADLTGADLTKATLIGVKLNGADLSAATLNEAVFTRVSLTDVKFNGAYLQKTRLIGTDLSNAQMSGADLTGANLTGAILTNADLSGSYLDEALLLGANLYEANLSGSSAKEANFNGSRLTRADLRGIDFSDSNPKTDQTGAYLSGVDARQTNFSKANLVGTDLSGSRFDGADFSGAVLCYSTPNGAIFSQATLDEAIFFCYVEEPIGSQNYVLHPADLFGVSFARASLRQTHLEGVTARGINLRGADLTGAFFRGVYAGENFQVSFQGMEADAYTKWPQVEVAQTNVTILTLLSWRVEDAKAMNRLLAAFNATNPTIRVEYRAITATEYNATLRQELAEGTAADLVYLRSFSGSRDIIDRSALAPLDTLPSLKTNFSTSALIPWMNSYGTPYGVPFIATSHGIYYNQTIFAELGLGIPQTWEELLTTAATLQSHGIMPLANGTKDEWTIAELVFMSLAPNFIGGREGRLAYLAGERCFNDAYVVAAFQAVENLRPFLPANPHQVDYAQSQYLFTSGQAAMIFDGSWNIPYYEAAQPDFEWSVFAVPPPAGAPGHVTFHSDAGVGLNAQSPNIDKAKEFLAWLTSPEAAELLANELPGFFPMHNDPPLITDQHASDFLALNVGRGTDVRWAWPGLNIGLPSGYALMQDGAIDILASRKTPQQAAEALQEGLARWFKPAQKCLAAPPP